MEMWVPFAAFLLVPGLLARIAFDPIFREKVVEMERAHPTENFHLGFDEYHSLQLHIGMNIFSSFARVFQRNWLKIGRYVPGYLLRKRVSGFV